MEADWFVGMAALYGALVVGWLLLSNALTRMLRRWLLRRGRPDIAAMSTDELWSYVRTFGLTSAFDFSVRYPDGVHVTVDLKVEGQRIKVEGRGDTLRAALLDVIGRVLAVKQNLGGLEALRQLGSRRGAKSDGPHA